jgi:hypothetical protein
MALQNQPNSVGFSPTATIPELQQSRQPYSVDSLLNTHDGAMNTPSAGSSPGIAASLGWSSTVPSQ